VASRFSKQPGEDRAGLSVKGHRKLPRSWSRSCCARPSGKSGESLG
jgi:hypothetical protein